MKAMLLHEIAPIAKNPKPLLFEDVPEPKPNAGEVLIRVSACGVCHTELDEIEGRTPHRICRSFWGIRWLGKSYKSQMSHKSQKSYKLETGSGWHGSLRLAESVSIV